MDELDEVHNTSASIHIKHFVCLSGVLFCLSPGNKHFSHTERGTNISFTQERGATNISHAGGDKHCLLEVVAAMIMLMKR